MRDPELITPEEAAELMPLIDPKQFVGGMYDPIEGHLDPYGVTHAYAKAARKNGATYFTNTKEKASAIRRRQWIVETNQALSGLSMWLIVVVSARSRPYGRAGTACAGNGTYVPADRRHA